MPRENRHKQQLMRARIAAAAARMMAEDGLEDLALAKRKAARQLGAESTHALPDNSEVEEALRDYQSLYHGEEQRARIAAMRRLALEAMQALADFRPYLCGAVLKGTAGRYGDIDLQLYTDDSKAVELFLLNRRLQYTVEDERRRVGDQARDISVLRLEWDGVPLKLAIYPANDERVAQRNAAGIKLIERAGIDAVRELVAADWLGAGNG
jgi:predicted nucleotidyltransferase